MAESSTSFPEKEILDFVRKEVNSLRGKILDNIDSSGKNATGKTKQSLKVVLDGTKTTLIGREDFENIETGTPPSRRNIDDLAKTIMVWAEAKGVPLRTEAALNAFSYNVANLIIQAGSKDYREGKRTNIFSNEVQDTWDAIDTFINDKIEYFLRTIRL